MERFVGTAQLIEFVPKLCGEKVRLPEEAMFLVANSLVTANKAASCAFNQRVAETRMATWILAKKLGAHNPMDFCKMKSLELEFGTNAEMLLKTAMKVLTQKPFSIAQVYLPVLIVDFNIY